MDTVVSVGIGYALGWALFSVLSLPGLAFEYSYLEEWYRILASVVGAMVTYPAGALIGHSIQGARLTGGLAIAVWVIGGISLLGFVFGFVSDWIAIHWFGPCCTSHFSEEARAEFRARGGRPFFYDSQYCGSYGQLKVDGGVALISISVYAGGAVWSVLNDNVAVRLFARLAEWLTAIPVLGWILTVFGGLFVLATFRQLLIWLVGCASRQWGGSDMEI
jgi:hypothetical protein